MKRLLVLILSMLMLAAGCSKENALNGGSESSVEPDGVYALAEDDTLAICEIAIGDELGEAKRVVEAGETSYRVFITLPVGTDFKNCVANIELPAESEISGESPCLKTDLGGRPVLDLTLENRDLIIENGGETRAYGFEIELK